jgi:predicted O-methyltransferase YrrM
MDLSFCPVLDEMIRTQRTVGQTGRVFEELGGALSTVNNLIVLRALMLERRPVRTLEIGLGHGGSALALAASHRDLGHEPAGQHTVVDPFQAEWDNAALAAFNRAGLDGYLDFRSELSATTLPALTAQRAAFGLIYVDGSHLFEDVFVDAYFGFRLLSNDGLILFDDSSIDHVARVLSFVTANWSGWTEEVDLSRYRADGGSLRYQVGKRLGKIQLRCFRRTGTDTRAWDVPLRPF